MKKPLVLIAFSLCVVVVTLGAPSCALAGNSSSRSVKVAEMKPVGSERVSPVGDQIRYCNSLMSLTKDQLCRQLGKASEKASTYTFSEKGIRACFFVPSDEATPISVHYTNDALGQFALADIEALLGDCNAGITNGDGTIDLRYDHSEHSEYLKYSVTFHLEVNKLTRISIRAV